MDSVRLRKYRNLRWRIIYEGQLRIIKTAEYAILDEDFDKLLFEECDPVAKMVLEMYYRDARSITFIAMFANYSETQIKRIKHAAVERSERRKTVC